MGSVCLLSNRCMWIMLWDLHRWVFSELPSICILYWCFLWLLLYTFRFWYGHSSCHWGSAAWVFTTAPFGTYPWKAHVASGIGLWSMQGVHRVATPPSSCYWNSCYPTIQTIWWGIHLQGLNSHPILLPFLYDWEFSRFGSIHWQNSKSVVSVKPDDSVM